ncbi:hypothetical protein K435DRAFT_865423 [Dendrothele bispora CBS 962.96]|uniref:CCHC-type domain-containing protein n=1 Tax=Dendrothele bispora (strain CBS 962.96) TaxID=1314807 RepID=A0A4S8LJT5_DENBC|nr:hypothetical protein K435DRAFT_865423 [Dendrothele bispora CBS 962.96]
MGSALDRRPATNSSQLKRYPTPYDALEDVRMQCQRLEEVLGVRRIETLSLEDHIQAVRALAEAREADLPIWVASRIREVDLNRELNRLYAVVRQPDVALIVPEDPSLPDPWGFTRNQLSPAQTPALWSWQQLEQQQAFERERERWRENMAHEVHRRAETVVRQNEDNDKMRSRRSFNLAPDPIACPSNPAVPSTTVYPSSSITSPNWARPTVKIVEPSDESNTDIPPGQEFRGYDFYASQADPNSPSNRNDWRKETREGVKLNESPNGKTEDEVHQTEQKRDVPPHQTPAQTYLKPGDFRPSRYKYTPFSKNTNAESSLRRSRRRLREILEDVEGERKHQGVGNVERTMRIDTSNEPTTVSRSKNNESEDLNYPKERGEDERIHRWEHRENNYGSRSNDDSPDNLPDSNGSAPLAPPPPPPPPPPPLSPPSPPADEIPKSYPINMGVDVVNAVMSSKSPNQTDDKITRDAITRESKLEIRKPTAFDGTNRELWRPFLSDCYRMFVAKPTIYSTDQSRVTYASSWLTGAAAKYYQNQVEQEMENGLWIPTLHEWGIFVREFGRLFGLHDEVLHAQASLDKVIQRFGESFADFIVRFEDVALKTLYNDPAKRWRLLLQIRKDLRDRLTLVGRIPETFDEVVKRLLDIDGAREAFKETGLSTPNQTNPYRRLNPNPTTTNPPISNTPNITSYDRSRNNQSQGNATRNAVAKSAQADSSTKMPTFRISKEERDRRMNEGLCIRCGGRGHFGKECTTHSHTVVGKCCFEVEADDEEPSELLYAIDSNGDFHQIDEDQVPEEQVESSPVDSNQDQGNEEGARDLNEGEK